MTAGVLLALALSAGPAGGDDPEAELRAAREDRAKIATHIQKIEAFRASLSLPKDAAADEKAAKALTASRDALAKADARLRQIERRESEAREKELVFTRAVRCAVGPALEALRDHGQDAAAVGEDVQRELESALSGMLRTELTPDQKDVVTVLRHLQRSSGGGEVQAVVDGLVTRSGATGDVFLHIQFSVGPAGRRSTEGQAVLVLDPAGRLKVGELPRAVRSCLARGH